MKYFWLIRHARASHAAESDFERGLSASGRSDGELMAQFLSSNILDTKQVPGWLITSAARRARQTSDYIARGFGVAAEGVCTERRLYHADPETLLDALKETPAEEHCAAVVAHNPGLTWLVNGLSMPDQQLDNLPTLGCALFRSDTNDWANLSQATRVSLFTPKIIGRASQSD